MTGQQEMVDRINGTARLTLRQLRAIDDGEHTQWPSPGYRRQFGRARRGHERALERRLQETTDNAFGLLHDHAKSLRRDAESWTATAEEIKDAVEHGRMSKDEGLRRLTEGYRAFQEVSAALESIDAGQQEAISRARTDVADLEEQMAERFPVLEAGVELTNKFLTSDDPWSSQG